MTTAHVNAEPPGFYYPHFEVGQLMQSSAEGANLVSDAFTLELWLRLDQAPDDPQNVLCAQQAFGLDFAPSDNTDRWWLSSETGGWSAFLVTNEGSTGTPPVALAAGSWVHLAATYDGSNLRLFADGAQVSSSAHSGSTALYPDWEFQPSCQFDPQMLVSIGGGYGGRAGWGFQGSVREVGLWDHALDAGALLARQSGSLAGTETGLLHFWPLDSGQDQEPNKVSGGPPIKLGMLEGDEGPYHSDPEWRLTDPFYAVREDLIDDLPYHEDIFQLESWGVIDLNQDGLDDLLYSGLAGCATVRKYQALLNDGTGRFVEGTSSVIEGPVPEAWGAFKAQVADFNGDGLLDFFSGSGGEELCGHEDFGWTNTLMLTNGAGKLVDASGQLLGPPCTLTEPAYPGQAHCYGGGVAPERPTGVRYADTTADPVPLFRDLSHSTATGDIDNDGDIDVFVGNYGGDGGYEAPYFLVNDSEGNFTVDYDAVPVDWGIPDSSGWTGYPDSHLDDLDGDGTVDLVACCRVEPENKVAPPGSFTVRGGIYWGDGSGDFSTAEHMLFPRAREEWASSTGGLLPLDIDGDGDKDLIITTEATSAVNGSLAQFPEDTPVNVQVLVNHGNRNFVDETATRISEQPTFLIFIIDLTELDINADGCPDFVIQIQGWYWKENIYVNDCSGRFTPLPPAVFGKLRQLVPIDIHGDGDVDFISYANPGPGNEGDFTVLEQLQPVDVSHWLPDPANSFTVGGSVIGLEGSGLVLRNNGGNNRAISENGSFTFSAPLANGSSYSVTVGTQPGSPNQTCTVTNGSGTISGANVNNVSVSCVTVEPGNFTVGGNVSGLEGSGLELQNNNGDDLHISNNGSFTFSTALSDSSSYSVTVKSQPSNPSQTCSVSNGSGTISGANVTNVAVSCATVQPGNYTIGGNVSGLEGSGLVLRNNGGDDLAVGGNGSFTFATALSDASSYSVTVKIQPSNPAQTCTVSNGSGTLSGANVTNVWVICVTDGPVGFTVGGSLTGLAGSGLVLQNNGGDDLTLNSNGSFTFSTGLDDASPYAVTVKTQPGGPSQLCAVSNAGGAISGVNVTNVLVHCTTKQSGEYSVGGTVNNLVGSGMVLRNNGDVDELEVVASGSFTFGLPVANGSPYEVTINNWPNQPSQSCELSNASGTIAGADVTDVVIDCVTDNFFVGGSVSGMTGSGLVLQNNGGDDQEIEFNDTFTFKTPIPDFTSFHVWVRNQPTNPLQTCTVSNGQGVLDGDNFNDVQVTCGEFLPFDLNAGFNDAWVSSIAPFQGMFITVFPTLKLVFVAWFTFDSVLPMGEPSAEFGADDQRWVTGLGFIDDNRVELAVELTSGGAFNTSDPLATQEGGYGTMVMEFYDCMNAVVDYQFPDAGLSGSMEITRVLESTHALCQVLTNP